MVHVATHNDNNGNIYRSLKYYNFKTLNFPGKCKNVCKMYMLFIFNKTSLTIEK